MSPKIFKSYHTPFFPWAISCKYTVSCLLSGSILFREICQDNCGSIVEGLYQVIQGKQPKTVRGLLHIIYGLPFQLGYEDLCGRRIVYAPIVEGLYQVIQGKQPKTVKGLLHIIYDLPLQLGYKDLCGRRIVYAPIVEGFH